MRRTRQLGRASSQLHRRPSLEPLESRQLLSTLPEAVAPGPALDVSAVEPAGGSYAGAANGFDTIVGGSAARSEFKVDGSGYSVAVIDAGVNYNHPALGGGYGTDRKVVAGLIASASEKDSGVAPGADIVALRVFNDAEKSDFNLVADALQWVVDHHDDYKITVVNISLSDGRNYTRNWYAGDGGVGERITGLIDKLAGLNIPVVTATGNSFAGQQGAGFTGIIANSISVTATDANDALLPNAQRLGSDVGGASATDLAAPGAGLLAPGSGSDFSSVSGTSFAAPLVSGAIVLMQQVYQSRFHSLPSVSNIDTWLKAGADLIKDPSTGISIGRLDIPETLRKIPVPVEQTLVPPPAPAPVVITPVVDPTPAPSAPTSDAQESPSPVVAAPPVATITPADTSDLWLNGKKVPASNLAETGSGVTSFLQKALRSLRDWWTPPATGRAPRVRVWGSTTTLGQSLPAGTLATLSSKTTTGGTGEGMPRAWQTFVSSRRPR